MIATMKHMILALSLLLSASMPAAAESYTASAPSSITVEKKGDDWILHQRTVRYEPFELIPDIITLHMVFPPRLATITAIADGAVDDQSKKVEVTIDAFSGGTLHHLVSFSDPGSESAIEGGKYFVITEPGCCALPPLHHVRNAETGAWLFDASGGFETGMTGWLEFDKTQVTAARPTTKERWAAFHGLIGDYGKDEAMVGHLSYGDRNGILSTLEVRMDKAKQPEEFMLDLPSCGALIWHEPGKPPGSGQLQRPAKDKCYDGSGYAPALMSKHAMLEMSLFGKVYADIPVTDDDRLDIAHAKLEPGMTLVPIAAEKH